MKPLHLYKVFYCRLMVQFEKAQTEVNETFEFYKTALVDRQQEVLKELENLYKTKQVPAGRQPATSKVVAKHNISAFLTKTSS